MDVLRFAFACAFMTSRDDRRAPMRCWIVADVGLRECVCLHAAHYYDAPAA